MNGLDHEALYLGAADRDRLGDIVESSLAVCKRHQFYLWTQGAVQSLVPHEILVCGMANGDGMHTHRFAITRYFREEHFAEISRPQNGLLPRVIAEWHRTGKPYFLGAGHVSTPGAPDLLELVQRNELCNMAVHGVRGPDGRLAGYFCFSRISCPFTPRLAYLIEIIVPYVYCTFARVLMQEDGQQLAARLTGHDVTPREAEVLRWVKEGKTNSDIAVILNLSPWTVKNHVQNTLKKLGVQNRAQAVSRAIAARLIQP